MHLSSLRTHTRISLFLHQSETRGVKRVGREHYASELISVNQATSGGEGYLSHAACDLFKVVVFVGFESVSPTVVEGKRDRVM